MRVRTRTRRGDQLRTFRASASYLAPASRGVSPSGVFFADRGIDLTRGFKALKVWLQLKANGVSKLGCIIEQNVRQVERFTASVSAHKKLQLLVPAPLNIVCFRYRAGSLNDTALDALKAELLLRMPERGIAVLSSTLLDGRFALRLAHVNHRTTDEDLLIAESAPVG